jgi:hypothetical protein
MQKAALQKTIDAISDPDKLKVCVADCRTQYFQSDSVIHEAHWLQPSADNPPRLFVLTLVYKDQNYPI